MEVQKRNSIRNAEKQEKIRLFLLKNKKKSRIPAFLLSLEKLLFAVPLYRRGCLRYLFLFLSFFIGSAISAFSSPLNDFDARPEWQALFNKDRYLAHLLETNSPSNSPLHRAWLENEIASLLRQPQYLKALRDSLLQGDAELYQTMLDSLLFLNLPSDYARSHLMEWIFGSDLALQSPLINFPTAPAIRTRFASYLLHHDRRSDQMINFIQTCCESQNLDLEQALRKQILDPKKIDESLLKNYRQLSCQSQLEFRYSLFQSGSRTGEIPVLSSEINPHFLSFAEMIWNHLLTKIEKNPALRDDYQKSLFQRSEPEQWMRLALTESLRQNKADDWFQSYLQAAQIPKSRYRAVFEALIQSRSEKRLKPELIAESSQERTPWRARLVELTQNDPAWSAYFLWHLTRAAEPITLQIRRSLPSLFTQQEILTLEWYRWRNPTAASLSSVALKNWGIRCGESLRDQDREWSLVWLHHDLPTQSLLQKTIISALDCNPSLVTTWVTILQGHQPSLQKAFTLWTRQNSPHPEMTHLSVFMDRLTASIQRKEWVGNVDLALFRVAFCNFLQTHEGWKEVSWRIGLESFQISQPLRELLLNYWIQHPENFWKLLTWKTLYSPDPQAEQKLLCWIRTQKIAEITLLALSKQNPEIQISTRSLWLDLFQAEPTFQKALENKKLHPTQQDDLDQRLKQATESLGTPFSPSSTNSQMNRNPSSASSSVSNLLLKGGDSSLADWILRQSELQKIWVTHLESKLTQYPNLLKQITKSLLAEKLLPQDSFSELIRMMIEDRLFFENLLSDPTLGFKTQNKLKL